MTKLELSDLVVEDIVLALGMRIAFIETGDVTLRANDAIQRGQHKLVNALSEEQKMLVMRMEQTRSTLLAEASRQRMQSIHR